MLTPPPMSKKTKAFVKFAQEFAEECGYLSSSPKKEIGIKVIMESLLLITLII